MTLFFFPPASTIRLPRETHTHLLETGMASASLALLPSDDCVPPPHIVTAVLRPPCLELLAEGIPRALFVAGQRDAEVITMYS